MWSASDKLNLMILWKCLTPLHTVSSTREAKSAAEVVGFTIWLWFRTRCSCEYSSVKFFIVLYSSARPVSLCCYLDPLYPVLAINLSWFTMHFAYSSDIHFLLSSTTPSLLLHISHINEQYFQIQIKTKLSTRSHCCCIDGWDMF